MAEQAGQVFGAGHPGGAKRHGGPVFHRGGWGACLGEESGNLVELPKILRRPKLLAVCLVIHPAVDRTFKQILPVVQQLYAGSGRQGVYPAPHYGILVNGSV